MLEAINLLRRENEELRLLYRQSPRSPPTPPRHGSDINDAFFSAALGDLKKEMAELRESVRKQQAEVGNVRTWVATAINSRVVGGKAQVRGELSGGRLPPPPIEQRVFSDRWSARQSVKSTRLIITDAELNDGTLTS